LRCAQLLRLYGKSHVAHELLVGVAQGKRHVVRRRPQHAAVVGQQTQETRRRCIGARHGGARLALFFVTRLGLLGAGAACLKAVIMRGGGRWGRGRLHWKQSFWLRPHTYTRIQ